MTRFQDTLVELLMTYGWAILVITALVAALIHFGVFSSDNVLPFDCDKFCEEHNMSHCAFTCGNQVVCYVRNNSNWTLVFEKGDKKWK